MEISQEDKPAAVSIGERFRTVRTLRKMTQKEFSVSLGIVQGFLCSIEKGKKLPSQTLLTALQHLYGLNPVWLKDGTGETFLASSSSGIQPGSTAIPLYALPPTSLDSLSALEVREYISVPEITADCFAFEYAGDFMSPTIRDGDIVIIKPGKRAVSGDIILIVSKWGDSFLRRYRQKGGEVFCSADNSSYSTFAPGAHAKVIGIVHAVWRKIKI
jgi:transcriptional regulator with XRE-family HTH domain